MEEELTLTEKYENYAKLLYHFLKTEQDITFEKHYKNPEVIGLIFSVDKQEGNKDVFHYAYINENEEFIRKTRRV